MSASEWETQKFTLRECLKKYEEAIRHVTKMNSQASSQSAPGINRHVSESYIEAANDLKSDSDRLIRKLLSNLDQMQKTISGHDPAKSAQLIRFKEQVSQSRKDWDRQWDMLSTTMNRHTLLNGSSSNSNDGTSGKTAGTLLNERGSLLQSMGMIDSTIETATAAETMIRQQNESLISITGKVGGVITRIPFVNTLLSRINSRQTQERIILSLVIGVCISIFIWMRVLK